MADPRQTLHDLIRRFGFSLAQDPQKCDRVMKVLCGNSGAQVSAIVAAIEDKIPTELVQNQSNWHDIRGDLIYRFKENRKLNHELALWTVDTWGLVLGIWSQSDLDRSNPGEGSSYSIRTHLQPVETTAKYANLSEWNKPPVYDLPPTPPSAKIHPYEFTTARVSFQGEVTPYNRDSPGGKFIETSLDLPIDGIKLEMVAIPGGIFQMGSPDYEEQRTMDEGPQHWVTISPFFMGRYQITQAQYERIMGVNPSCFPGKNHPVERVSWDDAQEFIQRLNRISGRAYRLPTEAEWEYAARAGTDTAFSYHGGVTPEMANYNGNSPYGTLPKGEYRTQTVAVDSLYPNPWGLYHIHGNVWEWVEDIYHVHYRGAPTDGSAWLTGDDSRKRVVRGGSWHFGAKFARSASRDWYYQIFRSGYYGFRIALSA
ncbi:MAG: formylglycine-generating enzyme family protein [Cyanobacteria bacterium LVE1205-1]